MKNILIALGCLSLFGCATIVKTEKKSVTFSAPDSNEVAKIQTPDGNYEIKGTTTIMVSRSKADIPIEVTCNGITNKGVIPTSFDWGWGGAGNLIFGGIPGWIVDGIATKAYDPPTNYNIAPLCAQKKSTAGLD